MTQRKFYEGDLVRFRKLKNSSGYPMTGRIVGHDDTYAIVKVYGIHGRGSVDEVNDVPLADLDNITDE